MNAVCLIIDGLQTGYLGCYGNSWVRTPTFDELTVESFLFDQALVDCPMLDSLCRSFWLARHAQGHDAPTSPDGTFMHRLRKAGVDSTLLTDDTAVADHLLARQFLDVIQLDPARNVAAASEEEGQFARFFAAACQWLQSAREPFLLWLHCHGLTAAWDAPYEIRQRCADEEDPAPPRFVRPPVEETPADCDPDVLLGFRQAYAGQVSLLDECLNMLLTWLRRSPLGKSTLLVVASARGYPLGVHREVGFPRGAENARLYGELIHVPWFFRLPDGTGAADRSDAIVQPGDLGATLLDWCEAGVEAAPWSGTSVLPLIRGEDFPPHDRALTILPNQRAFRTPAWHLRCADDAPDELYCKPDDRWEINEVSNRCPHVVEAMRQAMTEYAAGRVVLPLNEELMKGLI